MKNTFGIFSSPTRTDNSSCRNIQQYVCSSPIVPSSSPWRRRVDHHHHYCWKKIKDTFFFLSKQTHFGTIERTAERFESPILCTARTYRSSNQKPVYFIFLCINCFARRKRDILLLLLFLFLWFLLLSLSIIQQTTSDYVF